MRILVAGLGFAAIALLDELYRLGACERAECMVVAPSTVFEFLPMVPALVSGRARLEEVAWSLDGWLRRLGVAYARGRVARVGRNYVVTGEGERLGYDILVIAWGAEPSIPPVEGAREHAISVYRAEDVVRLARLLRDAEALAVVGAGPLGCEVAAEASYGSMLGHYALEEIVLVDMLPEPLAVLGNRRASKRVAELLWRRLGVKLVMGRRVARIEQRRIVLDNGQQLEVDAVALCTGVKGVRVELEHVKTTPQGFIPVDDRMMAAPNTYAVGDTAQPQTPCQPLKMAREAIRQARVAAHNIARQLGLKRRWKTYKPLITECRPLLGLELGGDHALLVLGKKLALETRLVHWYKRRQLQKLRSLTTPHAKPS